MKHKILEILDYLIPKRNYYLFLADNADYSNNIYLCNYLISNKIINPKLIFWVGPKNQKNFILKKFSNKVNYFPLKSFKGIYLFLCAKFLFFTHGPIDYLKSTKRYLFNLWHGITIKKLGLLLDSRYKSKIIKNQYLFCSSVIDKQLFKNIFNIELDRIFVTGLPRHDVLLDKSYQNKNFNLFLNYYNIKRKNLKKTILFAPTFKSWENFEDGWSRSNNLFSFKSDVDLIEFNNFLRSNKILLFCKLHPFEENIFFKNLSNIKFIITDDLLKLNLTIYDFLSCFDLLISDYSSLIYDFYYVKRNIFLILGDISIYFKNRGFVFKNYKNWLPGCKIYDYNSLRYNLKLFLNNPNIINFESENFSKFRFAFWDNKNCSRISDIIRKLQ
jgi:CDP-glycerol glycerophosphotransferase (TagB/SpsB family)